METLQDFTKSKLFVVDIAPSLEQYRDKILFPEKLVKANEMLKTAKLPKSKHRS